jgi:hypothetical protein
MAVFCCPVVFAAKDPDPMAVFVATPPEPNGAIKPATKTFEKTLLDIPFY